jgi:hypothetical protein
VAQPPLPLQVPAAVRVVPAHIAAPQLVLALGNAQLTALVLLQLPWHSALPEHAGREPCGWPEETVTQVPTLLAMSHAAHWPVQSLLQQTPSTQRPDWHSLPAAHDVPLPLLPQVSAAQWPGFAPRQLWQLPVQSASQQTPSVQKPLAHSLGAMQLWPAALSAQRWFASQWAAAPQSASLAQSTRHWPVAGSQRNEPQLCEVAAAHLPAPSQTAERAALSLAGSHVGVAQLPCAAPSPLAVGLQTPSVAGRLHAMQGDVHAWSQQ